VRVRHGRRLSAAQRNEVRRSILQGLRAADRLRRFKLANADEPAFAFSADVP